MRKLLMASMATLATSVAWAADLPRDPILHLTAAEWEEFEAHTLNANGAVGDDAVIMLNSHNEPVTVTCGGYTLVGPNPYKTVAGNPQQLAPWSVTYVKTRDFNTYCKDGVIAHSMLGRTQTGHLSGGSFRDTAVILFSGAR